MNPEESVDLACFVALLALSHLATYKLGWHRGWRSALSKYVNDLLKKGRERK